MSDDAPKSAYELAMERLRAEDEAAGVEAVTPLDDRQRAAIAEARAEANAKLAELEILHRKHLGGTGGDPAAIAELESNYAVDRERVESSLESKLARIRRGDD